MTPDQRTALLRLANGRQPFFASGDNKDAAYQQTMIHRQLVMAGFAACRVEGSGEYIALTPKGQQAIGVRA